MHYCIKCGQPVAEGAKFCNHCGTPVKPGISGNTCAKCGNALKPDEKFCPVCGAAANAEQAPPASGRPKPPEKKPRYTKEGRKIIDSGPRPPSAPARSIKPRPVKKTSFRDPGRPPAKKKKSSGMGWAGKGVIGILAFLVAGLMIIYLLPDDNGGSLPEDNETAARSVYNEVPDTSPSQKQSDNVDAEKTAAIIGDVTVDFGPFNLDKPAKVHVAEYPEKIIKKECKITTYDIKLDGKKKFDDYITITLPYDNDFIEKGNAYGCVAAQYFNEKSKAWEPVLYDIDTKKKVVNIRTDHLSRYGIFTIKNETKRRAYVSDFYVPERYYLEDANNLHLAIIKEFYSPKRSTGEKALSAGLNFWGTFSGHTGAAVNILTVGGMYSTKLINKMNDGFKSMGYAVSAIQLAYDLHRGDQKSAAINLTKNLMNQMVAEINSISLNLAFVGVYFIDYSLTNYGNAAMAERYKNLFKVYDYYNKNNNPHRRTLKEWRAFFIEKEKQHPDKPRLVSDLIMKEIDAYAGSFIEEMRLGTGNENTMEFDALAGEAGLKHVSWPNSGDILKIRGEGKQQLIDWLYPAFVSLNHYRRNKMKEALNKEIMEEQRIMNTVVPITIMEDLDADEEPDFANYTVCLRPLNDDADKKQWTGRLNDRGYIRTSFTIIGFVLAGEPNRVEIYDPEDDPEEDDPIFVKKFVVDPGGVTVYLESNELADGPWEIWYREGKGLYDSFDSEAFAESLRTGAVDVLTKSGAAEWKEGEKEKAAERQKKLDAEDKKDWSKAVDKLKTEYNSTINAGAVSIPGDKFEEFNKTFFFHKYNPVKKGNLYVFNMPDEDAEEGDEVLVILDLKSNEYFEAKVFYKSKVSVSIDYLKGKLKK